MWILPPTKEQEEAQYRQHAEEAERRRGEWEKKRADKDAWLKANTCTHCGQHPQIPPWLQG